MDIKNVDIKEYLNVNWVQVIFLFYIIVSQIMYPHVYFIMS